MRNIPEEKEYFRTSLFVWRLFLSLGTVTLFTDKNRQEPSRTDKSRQEPTRGIFIHFSIKILLIRPYVCVIYAN